MSESKFEDLLKEARNPARSPQHQKTNRQLGITFAILSFLILISSTYSEYASGEKFSESLGSNIASIYFFFPILMGLFAIIISLIPYKGWKFEERFLRLLLVMATLLYTIFLIFSLVFLINP